MLKTGIIAPVNWDPSIHYPHYKPPTFHFVRTTVVGGGNKYTIDILL